MQTHTLANLFFDLPQDRDSGQILARDSGQILAKDSGQVLARDSGQILARGSGQIRQIPGRKTFLSHALV